MWLLWVTVALSNAIAHSYSLCVRALFRNAYVLRYQETAVMSASLSDDGHASVVEALVRRGADVNYVNEVGRWYVFVDIEV